MAWTRTVAQLIALIRRAADIQGQTDRWPDTDVVDKLNDYLAELRMKLARSPGHSHWQKAGSISTVAGTAQYDLPSDFWQELAVQWIDGPVIHPIDSFELEETVGPYGNVSLIFPRYRLTGVKDAGVVQQIVFDPTPTGVRTMAVQYVPHGTQYAMPGDAATNVVGFNGYEKWAVWMAASDIIAEEERDPSYCVGQAQRLADVIDAAAKQVNHGPDYITITRDRDDETMSDRYLAGRW